MPALQEEKGQSCGLLWDFEMFGNSIETLPRKHPVIQNSKEGHEVIKILTFVGGRFAGLLLKLIFPNAMSPLYFWTRFICPFALAQSFPPFLSLLLEGLNICVAL